MKNRFYLSAVHVNVKLFLSRQFENKFSQLSTMKLLSRQENNTFLLFLTLLICIILKNQYLNKGLQGLKWKYVLGFYLQIK